MPVQTSVQLFTVREALEADLDATLAELAARGFTAVEPYDFVRRAEPLAAALRANGLTAPTGHVGSRDRWVIGPAQRSSTAPTAELPALFCSSSNLSAGVAVFSPFGAACCFSASGSCSLTCLRSSSRSSSRSILRMRSLRFIR